LARLIRCKLCPRCGSASFRKTRADAVVSLLKVRECRKCSQQYRPPMPLIIVLLFVLIGLGLMAWLGARALQVRFDHFQLLDRPVPIVMAAAGALVLLYALFKLVFQRGMRPPERHHWRERRESLPPAAPVGQAFIAIAPNPAVKVTPDEMSRPGASGTAAVAAPIAASFTAARKPAAAPRPTSVLAASVTTAPPATGAAPMARPLFHLHEMPMPSGPVLAALRRGTVIPAHALAINTRREFNERRMRGLTRYYLAAGAGGVAVAVHTTQFAIRKPKHNLLRPVLEVVSKELRHHEAVTGKSLVKIAGVCGSTKQAVAEAELAAGFGYDIGLINLSGLPAEATEYELVDHCKRVGRVIPLMGFYLQPAVGGRDLPMSFWQALAELPNVVAIKIAAFNRYKTLDVMRAVAEAGRALTPGWTRNGDADDQPIAIYTGNDDHIVEDLLGEVSFEVGGKQVSQRMVGGLLGHWACWTKAAVDTFETIRKTNESGTIPLEAAVLARQVTDMNGAIFDARNNFRGCIAGISEVLHRQGMLEGNECLDSSDVLSPGQAEEITRVTRAYPHLTDDEFIREHRDAWMK